MANISPRAATLLSTSGREQPRFVDNTVDQAKFGSARLIYKISHGRDAWASETIVKMTKAFGAKVEAFSPALVKEVLNKMGMKGLKDIKDVAIAERFTKELTHAMETPEIKSRMVSGKSREKTMRHVFGKKEEKAGGHRLLSRGVAMEKVGAGEPKIIPKPVWEGYQKVYVAIEKHMKSGQEVIVQKTMEELLNVIADRIKNPENLKNKSLVGYLTDDSLAGRILENSLAEIKKENPALGKVIGKALAECGFRG